MKGEGGGRAGTAVAGIQEGSARRALLYPRSIKRKVDRILPSNKIQLRFCHTFKLPGFLRGGFFFSFVSTGMKRAEMTTPQSSACVNDWPAVSSLRRTQLRSGAQRRCIVTASIHSCSFWLPCLLLIWACGSPVVQSTTSSYTWVLRPVHDALYFMEIELLVGEHASVCSINRKYKYKQALSLRICASRRQTLGFDCVLFANQRAAVGGSVWPHCLLIGRRRHCRLLRKTASSCRCHKA